jgi:hypothetical protein
MACRCGDFHKKCWYTWITFFYHFMKLWTCRAFQGNSFEGPIPASLSNLTKLTTLWVHLFSRCWSFFMVDNVMLDCWFLLQMSRRIGDIVDGTSSLVFISNLTSLSTLYVMLLPVDIIIMTKLRVPVIKSCYYRILRNCKVSGNLGPVDFSMFTALILL